MADELKPQLIVFHTGGTIVAEIEEPDCKIKNPYNIVPQANGNATLQPWMGELTNQKEFMISSEKILTICEPLGKIKDTYESLNS